MTPVADIRAELPFWILGPELFTAGQAFYLEEHLISLLPFGLSISKRNDSSHTFLL